LTQRIIGLDLAQRIEQGPTRAVKIAAGFEEMEDFPWTGSLPFFLYPPRVVAGDEAFCRIGAFVLPLVIRFHSRIL
jgi:hypothetical protein